jgi:DNA-binding NtrC family response regulator
MRGAVKILVVDDEPWACRLYERILRGEGYEVVTATSGRQALALAAEAPPALILLDVVMPDMDGVETLKELRERGHHGPVVMLTAYGTLRTAREAMLYGAYEYITKPFSLELLKSVLREGLQHRRSERIARACVP